MNMFVNDLILSVCVKTTEMLFVNRFEQLPVIEIKFTSKSYTNGDILLCVI